MKTRPLLRHGDFVKLHKRYRKEYLYELSNESDTIGDTFVVLRINGRSTKHIHSSNDGYCRLEVLNLRTNKICMFDRKQVWKTGRNWKDVTCSSNEQATMF